MRSEHSSLSSTVRAVLLLLASSAIVLASTTIAAAQYNNVPPPDNGVKGGGLTADPALEAPLGEVTEVQERASVSLLPLTGADLLLFLLVAGLTVLAGFVLLRWARRKQPLS